MPRNKNKKIQKPSQVIKSPSIVVRPMNNQPTRSYGPKRVNSAKSNVSLSKCAIKYALAIAKPFHPSAKGACLPVFPSPPSQKVTAYSRFTAYVGTASYGFVSFAPCLANDLFTAFCSATTYTGTTMAPLSAINTASVGISGQTLSNLPYSYTSLAGTLGANPVYGRIISYGVRISYTGTTLNESGSYYILTTPGHENVLAVANTLSTMGSYADCNVCSVTRETCEGTAFPISSLETMYASSSNVTGSSVPQLYPYSSNETAQNGGFTYSQGGNNIGSPVIGIQFQGVPGQSYLVEIVQHCEFVGSATSAVVTMTDSDQRGFEIVTAAAERLPQLKVSQPARDPLDLIRDAIYEVANNLKPYAVSALTTAGIAMLL